MCLSTFRGIEQFYKPISRLRDFAKSYDKTSYRILKKGPGSWIASKPMLESILFRCFFLNRWCLCYPSKKKIQWNQSDSQISVSNHCDYMYISCVFIQFITKYIYCLFIWFTTMIHSAEEWLVMCFVFLDIHWVLWLDCPRLWYFGSYYWYHLRSAQYKQWLRCSERVTL